MNNALRISEDERKALTTERTVERPKYTFFALDHAVRYSQANKPANLGEVNSLYEDFEDQYPEGTFEDWKQFYFNEHDGEERIESATEDAYRMLLTIREALKQLDKDDVYAFIEGIALYGTYEGNNADEAVKKKLIMEFPECRELEEDDGPINVHLQYGDHYLYLHLESENPPEGVGETSEIRIVPYQDLDDGSIRIDLTNLNFSLDEF